ncbi:MAG: AI-2E family transporter [Candidatus Paceibacteria bacterium]
MKRNRIEDISLLALFAGISLLLFFVFQPFFAVLSLAAVFALMLQTPYERLTRAFGGRKSIAALSVVGLMLIFFIVPLFFMGVQIFQEVQAVYASIQGNGAQYMRVVQSAIAQALPGFVFDINSYIGSALAFISNNLEALIYQTATILFDTFLMLIALFFFLRDGRSLLVSFLKVSPFGRKATDEILGSMQQTILSVVRGTLLIVLIRWLCVGIAFSLFGIPNAIFWSSIGALVGAIPGFGTAFAFVGAVIYLYLQGNIAGAIGMTILGGGAVVLIDNVLTSYFFGRGLAVSSLFVLFSILGGIVVFGPVGFILGPLVLSVFLSVIRVYDLAEQG